MEQEDNKNNQQQQQGGPPHPYENEAHAGLLRSDNVVNVVQQNMNSPLVNPHAHHSLDSPMSNKRATPDSPDEDEDDDDDDDEPDRKKQKGDDKGKKKKKAGGSGRRRIEIKFIENKSRRQVTFSRRKRGLMKKAYELTTLTGTQALVLIASETGHVYTFATPKLQPVVTLREGKELIQSCLNAPDNNYPSDNNYQHQGQQQVQPPHQQGSGAASNTQNIPKSEPHSHVSGSSQPHHQHHESHMIPMPYQPNSLPGIHHPGMQAHPSHGYPPPMTGYPTHVDHPGMGYGMGPPSHGHHIQGSQNHMRPFSS
eukprot:TRINITY_DN8830_c0_g1_i1.p1 TRINITY_DN8830_c0_g1~~TRINITY_DN8830_c0_g1_i1.p1  ORF type:complete len:311 (+),score=102.93 TRINITY_DN8830_c0_g1_i1:124-1056(+)